MLEIDKIQSQEIIIDRQLILKLIQLIDLTSLSSTDTKSSILPLIKKANIGVEGIYPAAVCVYANFGEYAKSQLNSNIKTAVVGGNFPTGQTLLAAKISELEQISRTDIDEIDIVINRGDANSEAYSKIENEISLLKNVIGSKHLKVILETGELENQEIIRKTAKAAIKGGADFIKTSTGKMVSGADPESVLTMCSVISEHFQNTNKKIGIKPSGGIRTLEEVLVYYKIVKSKLGEEWLNPHLFRIGASSLYDNLISELE